MVNDTRLWDDSSIYSIYEDASMFHILEEGRTLNKRWLKLDEGTEARIKKLNAQMTFSGPEIGVKSSSLIQKAIFMVQSGLPALRMPSQQRLYRSRGSVSINFHHESHDNPLGTTSNGVIIACLCLSVVCVQHQKFVAFVTHRFLLQALSKCITRHVPYLQR